MTQEQLNGILAAHREWVESDHKSGQRACLHGAKNILSIGPLGSRGGITYAVNHGGGKIMVQCGCWWGDLDKFSARVQEVYNGRQHGKAYQSAIEYIKAHAAAYWQQEEAAQ